MSCIFCRIVLGEEPCCKVLETASVLVFDDLHPQAPVHVLVVPKRHVASLFELEDERLAGELLLAARRAAWELGLEPGFRLIANNREHGGQAVAHLHLHVLGGRRLGRMLPRWL